MHIRIVGIVTYHPSSFGIVNEPHFFKWFQGKLQLWVDIFPLDSGVYTPAPTTISPRKIEEYELRMIVWDVQTSINFDQSKNIWKSHDLVVKAWVRKQNKSLTMFAVLQLRSNIDRNFIYTAGLEYKRMLSIQTSTTIVQLAKEISTGEWYFISYIIKLKERWLHLVCIIAEQKHLKQAMYLRTFCRYFLQYWRG